MKKVEDIFLNKIKTEQKLNKNLKIDLRTFEEEFLNQLTDIEKAIFIGKYYENKSLKTIAFENKISYPHARNISVQLKRSLSLSLNFIQEVNKKK